MAALSNDPLGSLAPEITYDVNHHASTRLARLAKEAGVGRFVYASTCSVYGAQSGDELVDEDAPLKPVTPVRDLEGPRRGRPRSRWPTTTSCRSRCATPPRSGSPRGCAPTSCSTTSSGTPCSPTWSRCCPTARRGVRSCTPRTSRAACSPRSPRPPTWCAAGPTTSGTERNNRTVAEIAQAVVEAVPTAKLAITGETGNDPRSYRVDFSRARKELGFEAAWTIPDGANQLATRVPRARPHPRAVRPALHPPRRARRAAEGGRAGRHDARQGLSTAPPGLRVGLVAE